MWATFNKRTSYQLRTVFKCIYKLSVLEDAFCFLSIPHMLALKQRQIPMYLSQLLNGTHYITSVFHRWINYIVGGGRGVFPYLSLSQTHWLQAVQSKSNFIWIRLLSNIQCRLVVSERKSFGWFDIHRVFWTINWWSMKANDIIHIYLGV